MTRHRWLGAFHAVFVVAIVVVTPHLAKAQPVVDPRFVEFTRSADHDRTTGGTPVVQFYSLAIFTQGGSNPLDTIDLGKPTPDANGNIRIAFVPLMHFTPAAGVIYEARVSAVGSGGVGASTVSNTFTFQSSGCAQPTISPTSQSVVAGGGTGSVTVTAATGCPWTAASGASWITVTSGASGSGNGSVGFRVAANSGAARSGTMTIGGRTFTVNQSPVCNHTLTPPNRTMSTGAGSGSVSVSVAAGCSWTARSNATWITATGSAAGPGTFTYSVTAHSGSPRTGTVTVGTATFTITQGNTSVPTVPAGLRIVGR
jgi:Putative binding domain, N-terminal